MTLTDTEFAFALGLEPAQSLAEVVQANEDGQAVKMYVGQFRLEGCAETTSQDRGGHELPSCDGNVGAMANQAMPEAAAIARGFGPCLGRLR